MFEQDYLVRMIMQLVQGVIRSLELARGANDPKASADMIEASIGEATPVDGVVLLSLSPESIADILQVSGTDSVLIEFVARSLLLAADYLDEAGDMATAQLRRAQGLALADAYAIDIDSNDDSFDGMKQYAQGLDNPAQ